jgi:hypothetical protein
MASSVHLVPQLPKLNEQRIGRQMKTRIRLYACFAVLLAVFWIGALPAAAVGPAANNNPQLAQPLASGLNVGTLGPGETAWYVLDREAQNGYGVRTVVLNMIYRPGQADVAPYVNFQVLSADEVERWLQGYADSYLAMGVFTTTDFDQDTSERLWSGSLPKEQLYYVRLFNNSAQTVEFHLMVLSQALETSVVEPQARLVEPDVSIPETQGSVVEPANMQPSAQTPANTSDNNLKPGTANEGTQWRLVAMALKSMSTEEGANWLMMANQVGWLPGGRPGDSNPAPVPVPGTSPLPAPQPAPPPVPQPVAQSNVVAAREPAADALQPAVNAPGPGAEPAAPAADQAKSPEAAAAALFALYPNVYPLMPLALHDGPNVGKLAPGGEHWYTFVHHEDRDRKLIAHMALTLFATPTDGNTSHYINFQIYPGGQLQLWQRGTPQDMVPMGQGQWVSRDHDPVTAERLWSGTVVNGDRYYVRVVNDTDAVIDYYLITNDVTHTELGDRVWAANPVNKYTLFQR